MLISVAMRLLSSGLAVPRRADVAVREGEEVAGERARPDRAVLQLHVRAHIDVLGEHGTRPQPAVLADDDPISKPALLERRRTDAHRVTGADIPQLRHG